MIKKDFEKERKKQLEGEVRGKKLLLHSCCAPCCSGVIDRLVDFFDITIYFYNPNINSEEEFNKRANEQIRFVKEKYGDKIRVIIEEYAKQDFLSAVKGLENEPERGIRCDKCFYLRLEKTFNYALQNGFDFITTTLTVSPYKNANLINAIGEKICKDNEKVKWLYADFKKGNGYLTSIENSKKYSLYRQDYCGCEFSLRDVQNRKN